MYCKLALLVSSMDIKIALLPADTHGQDEWSDWEAYLSDKQILYICSNPLSLAIGDWLQRQLLQLKQRSKNKLMARHYQAAVQAKLTSIDSNITIKWQKICSSQQTDQQAYMQKIMLRRQVLEWIKGRKLLYDEWLTLLNEQTDKSNEANSNDSEQMPPIAYVSKAELKYTWQWLLLQGYIQLRSAIEWSVNRRGKLELRCLRCYEKKLERASQACPYCGEYCYYCSSCLQMGRARTCTALLIGKYNSPLDNEQVNTPESLLQIEKFSLSDAQLMATTHALHFIYHRIQYLNGGTRKNINHRDAHPLSSQFLLWAVTGAGKTEMIFPLVAYMVALGGRVLLATPRRDVVLELMPRLSKAFPELSIVTLYGGSKQRWESGQLVLATTHQLMRFQHGFDLVIIDELDAFPYHGDERLYRVSAEARTPHGITILLSATPPAYLQKEIKKGRLAHIKLPVRFHRHPLPVPIRLKVPLVVEQLRSGSIPQSLISALKKSIAEGAQIFIFLQRIVHTEAYARLLRSIFPYVAIEATSSQDVRRTEKVLLFRQRHIRILVTTTILERGVTVPRSHVYICDAEAELFDEASLVQMAGRAGRSSDEPSGAVYFLSRQWSAAQKQAIKQIKEMNMLALQHGYLLPKYQEMSKRKGEG